MSSPLKKTEPLTLYTIDLCIYFSFVGLMLCAFVTAGKLYLLPVIVQTLTITLSATQPSPRDA